jgi:chromosome segregation ATPase
MGLLGKCRSRKKKEAEIESLNQALCRAITERDQARDDFRRQGQDVRGKSKEIASLRSALFTANADRDQARKELEQQRKQVKSLLQKSTDTSSQAELRSRVQRLTEEKQCLQTRNADNAKNLRVAGAVRGVLRQVSLRNRRHNPPKSAAETPSDCLR